ncbi:MAG: hypothetical protein ACXVNF_05620 [Neobacillus sp.]
MEEKNGFSYFKGKNRPLLLLIKAVFVQIVVYNSKKSHEINLFEVSPKKLSKKRVTPYDR